MTTEAGKFLLADRNMHDPECPRWKAIGSPDAPCDCTLPESVAAIEAEARRDAEARITALTTAINGFRWLGNNLHNRDTEAFRDYFEAALEDARLALGDDWQPIRVAARAVRDAKGTEPR